MVLNSNLVKQIICSDLKKRIFISNLEFWITWVALYSSATGNWICGWREVIQAPEGSCWLIIGRGRGNPEWCVDRRRNKARGGNYTSSELNHNSLCAAYLHYMGVCTGGRTLRLADQVRLRVRAAEALVPIPQAPVAVGCSKTHTVTLFLREVSGCGGREDNKLAPSPSSTAAVLKTSCIVQTWRRRKGFQTTQWKYTLSYDQL